MIDIHTHILPGLDDGAKSLDEAVELLRMASEDGTRAVVATPHISDGVYPNSLAAIEGKLSELQEMVRSELDIQIYMGAEVRIAPGLANRVTSGEVPTINDGGYLLLELPDEIVPPQTEELLFDLTVNKITPIITHVERYMWTKRNISRIEGFVHAGALVQVTAMSLTGGFGRATRKLSETLLKRGLVHVIASDAHSVTRRPTGLRAALDAAVKIVGEDEANDMVNATPQKIINGEPL